MFLMVPNVALQLSERREFKPDFTGAKRRPTAVGGGGEGALT